MEFVPSSTIALEGLRRDGDLGLRDLQPHDDLAIERQDLTREQQKPTTTKELSAGARRSSKKISHTGQQIYICVRGEGRKEFVLPILCHRPPGCVGSERFKDEHGIMRTPSTREDPTPCDDDTLVYKKLNAACYKHYGAWKWWIPFYGVVNAQEVNVSSLNAFLCDKYSNVLSSLSMVEQQTIRRAGQVFASIRSTSTKSASTPRESSTCDQNTMARTRYAKAIITSKSAETTWILLATVLGSRVTVHRLRMLRSESTSWTN